MKTVSRNAVAIILAAASTDAFTLPKARRAGLALYGTSRPDSSDAVAEAQRISEEYGATSKEARVAWDIVEEMDSNDSSAAISSAAPVATDQSKKMDYVNQVRSLAYLLEETKDKLAQMRNLASQLRELELADPSLSKLGPEAAGLKKALSEAKAALEVHGPGSEEAASAWVDLEMCAEDMECDIDTQTTYRYSAAALKAHHYYDAVVDSELLSEALDALDTIESLSRFIEVEKSRLDKLSS